MNKFQKNLSRTGDTIIKDRAESISKLAEMSQDSLVKNLQKQRIELEMKQQELLDMSPDNRYDLKPGKDFKGDAWVQDYQEVSLQLIENEVALGVAKETMKELFTDTSK